MQPVASESIFAFYCGMFGVLVVAAAVVGWLISFYFTLAGC
jgi:hypothetical protein